MDPAVAEAIRQSDTARVKQILQANDRMNFVQRILKPAEWPVLRDEVAGPGSWSTHSMGWAEIGKERTPIVYPTVVYDPETKGLKRLGGADAVNHARQTGEFIAFETPAEADWFSKSYKLGMGSGFVNPVQGALPGAQR